MLNEHTDGSLVNDMIWLCEVSRSARNSGWTDTVDNFESNLVSVCVFELPEDLNSPTTQLIALTTQKSVIKIPKTSKQF